MPAGIAADYSLKPSELAETLAVLVEARQQRRQHRDQCFAHCRRQHRTRVQQPQQIACHPISFSSIGGEVRY